TDLRGFTSLSERVEPEQVVSMLNNYLGATIQIIEQYRGTIDEFIGDAIFVLFGAATVIFLVGVLDDRRGVRWRWKLILQVTAAAALTFAGFKTSAFSLIPGMNYVVSILWIVGITNAFNFIDGMDGLCAGVAAITCGILAYFMAAYDHPLILLFLMALTGSLLGFLRFNFTPAKIFMGDGGSTFIGFMLAAVTLQASYSTIDTKTILPVLMPVLLLAIPLYDTSSVIMIRLANRRSPFQPDTNHLHHRLKRTGMSDRQAVMFIWIMAFAVGINSTLLAQVDALGGAVILVQMLAIMGLFVLMERVVTKEMKSLRLDCTDKLFSVPVQYQIIHSGSRPRGHGQVSSSAGVAREFTESGFHLYTETALSGEEMSDMLSGASFLKVELGLPDGSGNPKCDGITCICLLSGIERDHDRPPRLKLGIDKMSGKARRRYREFVDSNIPENGECETEA
ncbi:MAG: adenylate/guanylate cyclase domain-containing protein, partial [bacterium]